MVKIMIADDQQLIRESLKIILDSDPSFEVVKVVGSGQEVLDSLKTESVDIILMDVRMPNMSGVDCTRIVKKEYPNIKVIILTTFDDDEYIYDALKYGASGYLLKGCSLEELSSAIHSVLSGGACFNPNVAGKVAQFFSQMANSNSEFSLEHEEDFDLSDTERQKQPMTSSRLHASTATPTVRMERKIFLVISSPPPIGSPHRAQSRCARRFHRASGAGCGCAYPPCASRRSSPRPRPFPSADPA